MAEHDLGAAMQSPLLRLAMAIVGGLLLFVLLREARRIPKALLVLMGSAFLDMVGLLMIVPLLPFYVKKFGGDGTTVLSVPLGIGALTGIVVATFTLAQLLSAPLWGRFSDRFGRRPTLLIALLASALAYLVFGFADSLWLLVLSRLIQGAGGGTVGVIQAYVADSVEPAQRARALGWLSAATNLGVAIGPVVGGAAVVLGEVDLMPGTGELRLHDAMPGVVAALLCLLNMAFAFRWLAEPARHAPTAERPSVRAAFFSVLAHVDRPASRLILIYAIAIGAFQGITSVLALFLNARFGVTEATIGWFYMYIGAIAVFTRVLLLGRMVDRFGEARLSRIGVVLLATGVLTLPLAQGLPSLALGVALLPLGTAFTFPCVTSLLSRVIAPNERGLYMGLQQSYGGIARIAAPLFYGYCYDRLGIDVPFYVGAGLVLLTLPLAMGLAGLKATARTP